MIHDHKLITGAMLPETLGNGSKNMIPGKWATNRFIHVLSQGCVLATDEKPDNL